MKNNKANPLSSAISIPTSSNSLTTANGIKVHYTKKEYESVTSELHRFHVMIFNENEDMGLNCLAPTSNQLGFMPPYHGAMMTSHGIAIKFNDDNIPVQLITPFGALNIEHNCNIKTNNTLANLADSFAGSLKKAFETYKCSESEKVFAISTAYKEMNYQMQKVGTDNIKCASGFFDYQTQYKAWMNYTKEMEEAKIVSDNKLTKTLNDLHQTYTYYKAPVSAAVKEITADTFATIVQAFVLKLFTDSHSPLTPTKYAGVTIGTTVFKEAIHVALALDSNYLENFDNYLNIGVTTALTAGALFAGVSIPLTVIIPSAITFAALNYLEITPSDFKSYTGASMSLETTTEFFTNVIVKSGVNTILNKFPNISPLVDLSKQKGHLTLDATLEDRLTHLVRQAKTANLESATMKPDFSVGKFVQYSTTIVKNIINSATYTSTTKLNELTHNKFFMSSSSQTKTETQNSDNDFKSENKYTNANDNHSDFVYNNNYTLNDTDLAGNLTQISE